MKTLTAVGLALIGVLVLCAIVRLEIMTWSECRQTNSWYYCMRVLSR